MKTTVQASRNWRFLPMCASMPPLHHKLPDEEYDPEKSEVLQWIIKRGWLGKKSHKWAQDIMTLAYKQGFLQFDKEEGTWSGEVIPWGVDDDKWPHPIDKELKHLRA
jgi:hypothetical protein